MSIKEAVDEEALSLRSHNRLESGMVTEKACELGAFDRGMGEHRGKFGLGHVSDPVVGNRHKRRAKLKFGDGGGACISIEGACCLAGIAPVDSTA